MKNEWVLSDPCTTVISDLSCVEDWTIVNNELQRICKKVEVLSKIMEYVNQDCRCLDRDSKPAPPEYDPEMILIRISIITSTLCN
jgi:hypothetical protein